MSDDDTVRRELDPLAAAIANRVGIDLKLAIRMEYAVDGVFMLPRVTFEFHLPPDVRDAILREASG